MDGLIQWRTSGPEATSAWARLRQLLPFVAATLATLALTFLPPGQPRLPFLAGAAVLMAAGGVVVVLLPWDRWPPTLRVVPPTMYIAAVALVRHADGGSLSGYSPLVLIPLFWIALYGAKVHLLLVLAAIATMFAVPVVLVGPPLYDANELTRATIWMLVGAIVGVTVQQLTARMREANEQLAVAVWTDPLTGLGNRRAWNATVDREIAVAERNRTVLAIALLDLDRFKRFNDERGHQAGDELLRLVAQRWEALLRPSDVLVRWGGEEFAVLLPDTSGREAARVIDRLLAEVPEGQTASAGLAFRRPGDDATDVIRRADTLLYEAKAAGRDRLISELGRD